MKPFQSLVVLLLAVALGVIASQFLGTEQLRQFGEVIYRYGGNDYRSTVPQVALMVLVGLLVLWLLWSLLASPFRAWGRYRRKQGRARLIDGIQAHEQGQWQRAEKLLESAAEDKEVTAVAMVTAVRSAQARDDQAAVNQYLQRLAGEDATLHALLQAERLLVQERPVDAINLLDTATIQPLPPRGLWLRTEALARAERAHEAYGQLGALRKQKVLPDEAVAELETRLAAQSLLEAGDVNALAAQWEATPKALRSDPDVVSAYALRAVALDWDEPALLNIEQALDTRWDESLVQLYGQMPVDKLATRQANLQRWLANQPASPALLLALAVSRPASASTARPRTTCTARLPPVPVRPRGKRWANCSWNVASRPWPHSASPMRCASSAATTALHWRAPTRWSRRWARWFPSAPRWKNSR